MNIILAPDSFKGSLSMIQVAEAMKTGAQRVFPEAFFYLLPMADGGEGTVDSVLYCLDGKRVTAEAVDALERPIQSYFGILNNGTAIVEMAAASGLPLLQEAERDAMTATTYGTGQLIRAALDAGCRTVMVGIGGSATNDAGVGMAQALGIRFLDCNGQPVPAGGQYAGSIEHIDLSQMDPRIRETKFTVLCDVTNPLCGKNGASRVFGPQKGATPEQVEILDQNLSHFGSVVKKQFGVDYASKPGAGAAGGLGMALMAFLGAELQSGIDSMIQFSDFPSIAPEADLVITGEGRIDGQTVFGKVPVGVARAAKAFDLPVVAIGGCLSETARDVFCAGIDTVESCVYAPMSVEQAMEHAAQYLPDATERVLRSIKIGIDLEKKHMEH